MSKEKELLEAKLEGFYQSCEILLYAIKRLKTSLNDYAAIEYQDVFPKKNEDKVTFAHNTLTVLEDLFLEAYDQRIDAIKLELENE